jgi:hypothetical protein
VFCFVVLTNEVVRRAYSEKHFQCRTFGRSVTSPEIQIIVFLQLATVVLVNLSGKFAGKKPGKLLVR